MANTPSMATFALIPSTAEAYYPESPQSAFSTSSSDSIPTARSGGSGDQHEGPAPAAALHQRSVSTGAAPQVPPARVAAASRQQPPPPPVGAVLGGRPLGRAASLDALDASAFDSFAAASASGGPAPEPLLPPAVAVATPRRPSASAAYRPFDLPF